MAKYHNGKEIGIINMGGGQEIDKVFRGTDLIFSSDFDAFGPFPRTKPPYGYFKLTTVDVNENPLGDIPCIFRYGNRTVNIEYSYDNVSWTASNSATTIKTSSTGIIYLRVAPGINAVRINTEWNRSSPYGSHTCWKVGDSTSVYYKIEGDMRMLLNSSSPASVVTGENSCWFLWSNMAYLVYGTVPYINQCIDCNIIVPTGNTGGDGSLTFGSPFGGKMRRASIWKDGNWGGTIAEWVSWFWLFRNGYSGYVDMEAIQMDFVAWPGSAYFTTNSWWVLTPANTTYYIPNELPATTGNYALSAGAKVVRYNKAEYI